MTPDEKDGVSPHVRIRVDPATKTEWLTFIDESTQFSGLTDLIKTSVNNTISGEWELKPEDSETELPDDLDESLTDISNRLQAVETHLDDHTAAATDTPTTDNLNEQELMRIARQCHDVLPVVADKDHLLAMTPLQEVTIEPGIRPKITGAAQDIAVHIDEDTATVRQALIYLERQETARVESIVDDGTRRWYEIDPALDRQPLSSVEIAENLEPGLELTFRDGTEVER